MSSTKTKPEFDGDAQFCCQVCSNVGLMSVLDTRTALKKEHLDDRIRWTGIPCVHCGQSFTVEAFKELKDVPTDLGAPALTPGRSDNRGRQEAN
jgi:transcription elongation factor Elf1